jgi:hypothetical protein
MFLSFLATLGLLFFLQQQPIDFPHNVHTTEGVECIDCHSTVDTQAAATLPSVSKCMLCHEKVATDGPGVTVLREYAEKRREVPWARIYEFAESAHVKFRHAPHIQASISCESCHGDVASMTTASPVVKHTMGTCVSCHRQNQASDDCAVCHY